jgi:hypothetical protein
MVTGSTLQEDIAPIARRVVEQGQNILGLSFPEQRHQQPCSTYDCQTPAPSGSAAANPPSFSWVDHRLIRHTRLRGCDHSAWALYLFLVTVGDVQGLSYYSDAAISRHLKMDLLQLAGARQQLLQADLIVFPETVTTGFDPAMDAQALWDLVGKALNQPVYQLLGGKAVDKLVFNFFIHTENTPDGPRKAAEELRAKLLQQVQPGARDARHGTRSYCEHVRRPV